MGYTSSKPDVEGAKGYDTIPFMNLSNNIPVRFLPQLLIWKTINPKKDHNGESPHCVSFFFAIHPFAG